MLLFGLHLHLHVHFHHVGPAFDYVGIALASFASWVGVPGPGEALLLAAGVFAARHKLDITPVVLVAFLGATLGGIVGWLAGLLAGRSVLTAPGPLRSIRLDAVERGEEAFKRMEVIAILLTPPWVAGIFRSGPWLYNVVNVVSAAVWAVTVAVGGYYIGPPVLDVVDDMGTLGLVLVILVVVVGVGAAVVRRQRGAVKRVTEREGGSPGKARS
jgi:membrane protein DedA with SNARE-associated domain